MIYQTGFPLLDTRITTVSSSLAETSLRFAKPNL
jgi:hypothetical protein